VQRGTLPEGFFSRNPFLAKERAPYLLDDQVTIQHYDMKVDLRDPRRIMKVNAKMDLQMRAPVQALTFALSESLPEDAALRKKKGMHITSARLCEGAYQSQSRLF
jgi:hypothetical protein